MKRLLALAITSAFVFAAPAFAADPPKDTNAQQERMKDCNARAGDRKGDERKAFMSACLSGKESTKTTQQEKMKVCNTRAADKKGDERKAFMSECLKGPTPG